jgi:hypothetical protein
MSASASAALPLRRRGEAPSPPAPSSPALLPNGRRDGRGRRIGAGWEAEAAALARGGAKAAAIAAAIGCSRRSVLRALAERGLSALPGRPRVDRAKIAEMTRAKIPAAEIAAALCCARYSVYRALGELRLAPAPAPPKPRREIAVPAWASDFAAEYSAWARQGGEFYAAAEARRLKRQARLAV